MNLIRINKKYGIVVSSTDYCVCQFNIIKGIKKASDRVGEEVIKPLTYHSSLVDALNKIVKLTVRDSCRKGEISLKEAVNNIDNSLNELKELIELAVPNVKVVKK